MSAFTDAALAIHGVSGMTLLFACDCRDLGGATYAYAINTPPDIRADLTPSGAPTVGGVTGPCTADTINPNRATLLNGSTQGFDLGVVAGFLEALVTPGLSLALWVKGSGNAQQRTLIGIWNGAARYTGGGMELSFGTSVVTGLASAATKNIFVTALDAAAATLAWNSVASNIGRCIDDAIWNLIVINLVKVDATHATLAIYVNDSPQATTQQYATNTSGAFTTTGHVVLGGYSIGATPVFTYDQPLGPIAAFTGILTSAQRRALLLAGPPTIDNIPMAAHRFRADGGLNSTTDGATISPWASEVADLDTVVNTGSTGGPKLLIAANGGSRSISMDNLFIADYAQAYKNVALTTPIHPNLFTIACAWRPGSYSAPSLSGIELVKLLASDDTELATLLPRSGASASFPYSVSFSRSGTPFINDTKPFLRTGPGLVTAAITFDNGTLTMYQDGEAGFSNNNPNSNPIALSTKLATKLYIGGLAVLNGACSHGWHHEFNIWRTAATATEIAAWRAAAIARWKLGQESITSDIEVIGAGDSIMVGFRSVDGKSWWMMLAKQHMGPRWLNRGVSAYKVADVAALGWTSTSPAYVAGTPSKSFLLSAVSINDIAADIAAVVGASTSATNWWNSMKSGVLDPYRVVRPTGKIIMVGPTPGDASQLAYRHAYEAKALVAGPAAYGADFKYVSLESLIGVGTYSDNIHPDNVAHAAIAALVDGGMTLADPIAFPGAAGSLNLLLD